MQGNHLLHLLEWLHKETEHGGALTIVGIIVGGAVGLLVYPLMAPDPECVELGIAPTCPDVFSAEDLIKVLVLAVAGGLIGIAAGWVAAQFKTSST